MANSEKKAIFLDRDGTLIVEKNYLHKPEDVEHEKQVIPALKQLQKKGFIFIIITNQSGIGRGMFKLHHFLATQRHLSDLLKQEGILIHDFFYCPYHKQASIRRFRKDSYDRKPNPGMIEKAIKKHNINPKKSYMIGDKLIDVQAGQACKIKSILVKTGYGEKESQIESSVTPDYIATDLLDATTTFIA